MTVYEAMEKSLITAPVMADRIGLGAVIIRRLLEGMDYNESTGCWIWRGAKRKGYGVIHLRGIPAPTSRTVSRLCYELVNGPAKRGNHIHHQVEFGCSGPACANPDHVIEVRPDVHSRLTPSSPSGMNAFKDRCIKGHPFSKKNTLITAKQRICRECCRLREQAKRDVALAAEGRTKFKWRKEHIKTVCNNGHDLTDESNIYVDGKGFRCCRGCRKMHNDLQTAQRRTAN